MKCAWCETKQGAISFTEEMILNYDALPEKMYGWRRYRIEYGFECSCPEGTVYLPPDVDADKLEDFINALVEKKNNEPTKNVRAD